MSSIATFNLLSFVERKPFLSAKKIVLIVILFAAILFGDGIFEWMQIAKIAENISVEEGRLNKSTQALQSLIYPQHNNPLIDVTTLNLTQVRQDFYASFEALSHVHVPGLWLNEVKIKRNPLFVRINGATDSTEKLNRLLEQLSQQPAFKNIQFKDIQVYPELFKDLPKEYQHELASFKLPKLYHFVIQTTADPSVRKEQW